MIQYAFEINMHIKYDNLIGINLILPVYVWYKHCTNINVLTLEYYLGGILLEMAYKDRLTSDRMLNDKIR